MLPGVIATKATAKDPSSAFAYQCTMQGEGERSTKAQHPHHYAQEGQPQLPGVPAILADGAMHVGEVPFQIGQSHRRGHYLLRLPQQDAGNECLKVAKGRSSELLPQLRKQLDKSLRKLYTFYGSYLLTSGGGADGTTAKERAFSICSKKNNPKTTKLQLLDFHS